MQQLKKTLKLMLLVLLIVLASLGIGLTGVAPTLPKNRGSHNEEKTKTELTESKKKKTASDHLLR